LERQKKVYDVTLLLLGAVLEFVGVGNWRNPHQAETLLIRALGRLHFFVLNVVLVHRSS